MRQIIWLSILGFSFSLAACEQPAKKEPTKIAGGPEKAAKEKEDTVEELRVCEKMYTHARQMFVGMRSFFHERTIDVVCIAA